MKQRRGTQLGRVQYDQGRRSLDRRVADRGIRRRGEFFRSGRGVYRCIDLDLLDGYPAGTDGGHAFVGTGELERRSALRLVQPHGVCTAHRRACAAHLCDAVSNADAGLSKRLLKVGPEGLGIMLAAPGLGAMLAGLANRVRRQGVLMLASLVALGIAMNMFSWTTSFPLAILSLVNIGAFQIFYMATTNTMFQVIVPDHLRGRVMSIYALDRGLMTIGALTAGVSAHWIGAPATASYMGIAVILMAGLVAWRAPVVGDLGVS
jgi:Transmembrane secretion effector